MSSPAERVTYYHRRPKSVLRALGKAQGGKYHGEKGAEAEPFAKEQILDWINAAAPMAASKLICQLASRGDFIIREDPQSAISVQDQLQKAVEAGFIKATQVGFIDGALAQNAAIKILEWAVGKPLSAKVEPGDGRAMALYQIVAPDKAVSFDAWIASLNERSETPEGNLEEPAWASDRPSIVPGK